MKTLNRKPQNLHPKSQILNQKNSFRNHKIRLNFFFRQNFDFLLGSITQSSSNSAMTSGDSNSKSPSRNVSSITCSVSNKTGTAINTVSNATGATTNTVSDTTGSSVTIGGGASSSGPKSNGFKG